MRSPIPFQPGTPATSNFTCWNTPKVFLCSDDKLVIRDICNGLVFDILDTRIWLLGSRLATDELASARDVPCLACKTCIDAHLPMSDLLIRAA